jgi:hypothetical protein
MSDGEVLTKSDCNIRLGNDAPNHHIGIIGTSGSGKTEWLFQLVRQFRIAIVFDTGGEFNNTSFIRVSDLKQLWTKWNEGYSRLVYTPSDKGNHLMELASIIHQFYLMRHKKFPHRVHICIPEISTYAIQNTILHPELQWLLKQGRKFGIDCIYDTQRIADTSKIVIQETAYFYIFQQFGRDFERIVEYFPEIEPYLNRLEMYEFILWVPKTRSLTIYNKLPY